MTNFTHLNSINVRGSVETSTQGKLLGSFDTMPIASSLNAGQIVLYTGTTTSEYTKGKYYVSNGTAWTVSDASPSSVVVDSELSTTSANPVQNKVITPVLNKLRTDVDSKVPAVSGKGLSTNDYTTAEKEKLAGIEGVYLSKTDAANTYATKSDIASVYKYKGSVASYEALPASGMSVGDTYNVEAAHGNVKAGTNWAWNGTAWDALAGAVDLTGLQPKLTQGTGITISGNTVSLTDSGVTAGSAGSATTIPVITVDSKGRVTALSSTTAYPPTTAGSNGQYWKSDGSGAGVWTSPATAAAEGSSTLVSAGGLHTELAKKMDNKAIDSAPTQNSANLVTSGGVFSAINNVSSAIAGKQDKLTFDSTPKSGSKNPVTSGGIYQAIKTASEGSSQGVLVRYDAYPNPVPVMKGWKYTQDNGASWTTINKDGVLNPPFTGVIWVTSKYSGKLPVNFNLKSTRSTNTFSDSSNINWSGYGVPACVLNNVGYILCPNETGSDPYKQRFVKVLPDGSYTYETLTLYPNYKYHEGTLVPLGDILLYLAFRVYYNTNTYAGSPIMINTSGGLIEKRDCNCGMAYVATAQKDGVYIFGGSIYNRSEQRGYTCNYVVHFHEDRTYTDCTPLNERTQHATAFTLGNKVYVCGGWKDSAIYSNVVEVYTDDSTKTLGTTLITGMYGGVSVVFNNKGYVIGGVNSHYINIFDVNGVRTEMSVDESYGIGDNDGTEAYLLSNRLIFHQSLYSRDWIGIIDSNGALTFETVVKSGDKADASNHATFPFGTNTIFFNSGNYGTYKHGIDNLKMSSKFPVTEGSEYTIGSEWNVALESKTIETLNPNVTIKYSAGTVPSA